MAKLTSDEDLTMTFHAHCLRALSALVLILGVSLASVPIVLADGPNGPPRPPSPELIEKMHQDLEKAEREYQAQPKPAPLTGILPGDMIGSAFGAGSSYLLLENAWHEIVNGVEVTVYAGSLRFNPATQVSYDPLTVHGFVIIQKGEMGEPSTKMNRVYTPIAVGSLHIIAAKGNMLTLQSRQGNKFWLNVETEQLGAQ